MGLIMSILVSVSLIYGGTYSVELLLDRYATPEARADAGKGTDR
jgi:hypothetical protein